MLFSWVVSSDCAECVNELVQFNEVKLLTACSVGRKVDARESAGFMKHRHKDVAVNELVAQELEVSIFGLDGVEIE